MSAHCTTYCIILTFRSLPRKFENNNFRIIILYNYLCYPTEIARHINCATDYAIFLAGTEIHFYDLRSTANLFLENRLNDVRCTFFLHCLPRGLIKSLRFIVWYEVCFWSSVSRLLRSSQLGALNLIPWVHRRKAPSRGTVQQAGRVLELWEDLAWAVWVQDKSFHFWQIFIFSVAVCPTRSWSSVEGQLGTLC